MSHGHVIEHGFLTKEEVSYWSEQIDRLTVTHGTRGSVRKGDSFEVSLKDRDCSVYFLDAWVDPPDGTPSDFEEMAHSLLYKIVGLCQVAAYTHLKNDNLSLQYNSRNFLQMARYGEGEMYNLHRDNSGDKLNSRQVSACVAVSVPERGGRFEFRDKDVHGINRPGTAIAFPSTAYHKVTPVEQGVRRSLTLWHDGIPN